MDSNTRKETLYINAIEWLSKHFNNASKVTEISDKEVGVISAKGSFIYIPPSSILSGGFARRSISFASKLSFKDGKYKLDLNNFSDDLMGLITNGD